MEQVKVWRGAKALEIIEEMLDNGFVLTPDYRLVSLPKGYVLIKKEQNVGPTETTGIIDIREVWPNGSQWGAVRPSVIKKGSEGKS